jgi:hypothetical protein
MTFCHKFASSKAAILDADPVAVKSSHSFADDCLAHQGRPRMR